MQVLTTQKVIAVLVNSNNISRRGVMMKPIQPISKVSIAIRTISRHRAAAERRERLMQMINKEYPFSYL